VKGFSVRWRESAGPMEIPANALVVLIGASGSGKSTWAGRWFHESQVVSSDRCRMLVADSEADQSVNRQAFAVFYEIIRQRMVLGRLTVADSTGLQAFSRARLREVAARNGAPVHVVVFCAPLRRLVENNAARARRVSPDVIARHARTLTQLLESDALEAEGYDGIHRVLPPACTRPNIVPPVVPARMATHAGREGVARLPNRTEP
jgi:predicted kinase